MDERNLAAWSLPPVSYRTNLSTSSDLRPDKRPPQPRKYSFNLGTLQDIFGETFSSSSVSRSFAISVRTPRRLSSVVGQPLTDDGDARSLTRTIFMESIYCICFRHGNARLLAVFCVKPLPTAILSILTKDPKDKGTIAAALHPGHASIFDWRR